MLNLYLARHDEKRVYNIDNRRIKGVLRGLIVRIFFFSSYDDETTFGDV